MYEALLFIWLGASNSQTFSAIRYDSMAQCLLARDVTVRYIQENSTQSGKYVECREVLRITPEQAKEFRENRIPKNMKEALENRKGN